MGRGGMGWDDILHECQLATQSPIIAKPIIDQVGMRSSAIGVVDTGEGYGIHLSNTENSIELNCSTVGSELKPTYV